MSKTYAVTGVASGIGAEIAAKLKADGHRVIGFDRQETADNIDEFIALDLNDPASIAQAAAACRWSLDGLCNNAGVPPRDGLEAMILQVNFLGTRAFTRAMTDKLTAGASLVNMASRAGHGWQQNLDQNKRLAVLSGPEDAAAFVASEEIDATRCYNLSKEAMILWSLAITEEMVARDVRVNSISPGGVSTGILDDFRRAFGEKMARNVARAGRPGNPGEIASIAAFALSPDSGWLKGADIAVDGGMGAFNMTDALGLDVMRTGTQ